MNSARSHPHMYHRHRSDPQAAARRFWIDLLLACLAGIILALTVAAVWSDGAL